MAMPDKPAPMTMTRGFLALPSALPAVFAGLEIFSVSETPIFFSRFRLYRFIGGHSTPNHHHVQLASADMLAVEPTVGRCHEFSLMEVN
jgi:hypothetical protein